VYDYIHWRFSPGGDIDRIKRQQKFMSTFFKQQRDNGKLLETLYVVLKHDVHIETDLTM
jgi:anionic cell wall polymer biosynthesis LytR-Cps2A-Psr (LCP) family protein